MITIIFDTETTGLLKPELNLLSVQPCITEIFCLKIDENFNEIGEFYARIKPSTPIPKFLEAKIGITNEMLEECPSFADIYDSLAEFFKGSDRMVAHNIGFDRSMLANELLRIEKVLKFPWPKEHICTVEKSMHIEQRRINLTNLHTNLFGVGFDGAHSAKADVQALARCYKALCEAE